MAAPALHLTIDKGPKRGETLDPDPTAEIRIGRVIKGNTFTIRDPAISQQHLTIKYIAGISRWSITDLDTSNGTFVNDETIPPSFPFPLSDGDTIKIGATTSISVKIRAEGEADADLKAGDEEEPTNLRRGRSRRAAGSRALEKAEILNAEVEVSRQLRPRKGAASSARISKDETGVADVAMSLKEAVVLDSDLEDSVAIVAENTGRGRGRGRRAPARARASSAKDDDEEEKAAEESAVAISRNTRRGRGRKPPARARAAAAETKKDDEVEEEEEERVVEDSIEAPKNTKRRVVEDNVAIAKALISEGKNGIFDLFGWKCSS